MKRSRLVLALWLGASMWAQTLPQKPQVAPPAPAKPSATRTASPATASPDTPVQAKRSSSKRHSSTKETAQPSAKTAMVKNGMPASAIKGQRDPFVSPVVERVREFGSCTGSGRKCLLVSEISLHGVVRSSSGYIAVVVNGDHTYFLRENDPLANGAVERITNDAIIMRERSSDVLGRPLTHEVTKKLGVPAV